jgi:PAS domain S-box-containing protein
VHLAARTLGEGLQRSRRNEELFRAVVEDQTEMIVRWKPDGTRTFVNRAYSQVFGGSPEDFIGSSFMPLVAEEYREASAPRSVR